MKEIVAAVVCQWIGHGLSTDLFTGVTRQCPLADTVVIFVVKQFPTLFFIFK